LRNQSWTSYGGNLGRRITLIIAFAAFFMSNIKWSWINCKAVPSISILRKDGKYKILQNINFRNSGAAPGALDSITEKVVDPTNNKTIETFITDSIKIDNMQNDVFTQTELSVGHTTKCLTGFVQQSDESLIWKPNIIYKLVVTVTTISSIAYFDKFKKEQIIYGFTLSPSDIESISSNNPKALNNVRRIKLTPLY